MAKGEFVCVSHNDVEYYEVGWLDKIIEFMRDNPHAGLVALAGRKGVRENGRYDNGTLITGLVNYNHKGERDFEEVAVIDGLCYVMRNIGLRLDESYGFMHFYDQDLSMQYAQLGYKSYIYSTPCLHLAEGKGHGAPNSTRTLKSYLDLVHTDGNQIVASGKIFREKWKGYLPYEVC